MAVWGLEEMGSCPEEEGAAGLYGVKVPNAPSRKQAQGALWSGRARAWPQADGGSLSSPVGPGAGSLHFSGPCLSMRVGVRDEM